MPPSVDPDHPVLELVDGRATELGGIPIRRLLPRRPRRTVGAWCFLDQMGPSDALLEVGPHPHIGLQTVTWLLDGEVLHRDSLGSEQPIRPGQLNLMTAGDGIAHSEEGQRGPIEGAQLWVAQPGATRHGPAAFEHHEELPSVRIGDLDATVLVGAFGSEASPARHDTPLVGVELRATSRGSTTMDLDATFEHAVAVLRGSAAIGASAGPGGEADLVAPSGHLVHLGPGRDHVAIATSDDAVLLLLGGEPFDEPLVMWWNFVARSFDEVDAASAAWNAGERFGDVASPLARIPAPPR